MRIRNPKFSFLLFIIIIILSSTIAFSSCRYIHRSLSNEDEQPSKTDFFAWHFPTKSSEELKQKRVDQFMKFPIEQFQEDQTHFTID
ncbi:hypothetical protein ES319_D08G216800v1 [Gossypium barbadense]|uniref:Uncharacterized protein n=2 Tax=Gossypium TaxID=3633 RepID=A0A5J5QH89_GOSBA|nr:hypothetical protein ES319_D08G216800v1 [Gossypium barbadense]TYG58508.1 hypothetical protein ES288_D08G228700v1 [Gossypium darwinii]